MNTTTGGAGSAPGERPEAGPGGQPLRVMVVDDHPMWRDAVARDLAAAGLDVVATAGDGPQAVRRALAVRPQVLVLDLNLPGLPGAEVCRRLARSAGADAPKVLVLSASGEQEDVLEAVKAGATGYLVKSASADDLLDAVRRTAGGEPVFTAGLAGLVLGEFRRLAASGERPESPGASGGRPSSGARPPSGEGPASGARRAGEAPGVPRLTERETEVLRLVAKGLTYRQIAERLVISHRTVQNHVQNTLGKLQLHNRVELVRFAIERGLTAEE